MMRIPCDYTRCYQDATHRLEDHGVPLGRFCGKHFRNAVETLYPAYDLSDWDEYQRDHLIDQSTADHIASSEDLRRWLQGIGELRELTGPLPESIDKRVRRLQKALSMALRAAEERDIHAAKNYHNKKEAGK
ncbi:hypothetical protein [Corynebacterium ciconiae]|uniref:hypothetical protein n=1 Tax=Corynebacterium ciconiae TaxID=227319 RepID=UPI0012EA619D|nr:hypothetical protein [Corynebacterium ciconiae]